MAKKDKFKRVFSQPIDKREKVFFVLVDKPVMCRVQGDERKAWVVALQPTIIGMSSDQRRLLLVELLREISIYRKPEKYLRIILPCDKDFLKVVSDCYLSDM